MNVTDDPFGGRDDTNLFPYPPKHLAAYQNLAVDPPLAPRKTVVYDDLPTDE